MPGLFDLECMHLHVLQQRMSARRVYQGVSCSASSHCSSPGCSLVYITLSTSSPSCWPCCCRAGQGARERRAAAAPDARLQRFSRGRPAAAPDAAAAARARPAAAAERSRRATRCAWCSAPRAATCRRAPRLLVLCSLVAHSEPIRALRARALVLSYASCQQCNTRRTLEAWFAAAQALPACRAGVFQRRQGCEFVGCTGRRRMGWQEAAVECCCGWRCPKTARLQFRR